MSHADYLRLFDSKTYGEIHKQPWFKEMIKKFDSGLKLYKQFHCRICKELWPTKFNRCETCLKNEHKYVTSNKMDPSLEKIPIEIRKIFEEATTLEQLLVSPIVPVMSIERLSSGHLKNSGYCASFVQDLQPLCTLLPRLPTEVSVLVIKDNNDPNKMQEYKCRRYYVETMLKFLIANHPYYISNNIEISMERLDSLPTNGIPLNLPTIEENEFEDKSNNKINETNDTNESADDSDEEYKTIHEYIDIEEIDQKEKDKIKQFINYPDLSAKPINEYNVPGLYSLVFPTLFPFGFADPTDLARLIPVKENDAIAHLMKYAITNSNGKLYYPFASNSRFIFYAHDRIKRHATIKQCKVYLNQNTNDANLTADDLKHMNSNKK